MYTMEQDWPALPLEEWEATYRTLHMWTQIVGKIRLMLAPLENHFWNVALYVNTRGLTTSPIPYRGETFEIQFDLVHHRLEVRRRIASGPLLWARGRWPPFMRNYFFSCTESALRCRSTVSRRKWRIRFFLIRTRRISHMTRCMRIVCGDSAVHRYCVAGVSGALHRQIEPGPFFLGEFRFVLHTIQMVRRAPARKGSDHLRVVLA